MRRPAIGLLALAACGLYGAVALKAEDPIVPVYHEPHHRQVFQSRPHEDSRPPDTAGYHDVVSHARGAHPVHQPLDVAKPHAESGAGVGHRRSAKASRQRRPAGAATSLPSAGCFRATRDQHD